MHLWHPNTYNCPTFPPLAPCHEMSISELPDCVGLLRFLFPRCFFLKLKKNVSKGWLCIRSSWTGCIAELESSVSVSISGGNVFILILCHAAYFISGVALYPGNAHTSTSTQQCATHYFNWQVNFKLRKFQFYLRWWLPIWRKWMKNKGGTKMGNIALKSYSNIFKL